MKRATKATRTKWTNTLTGMGFDRNRVEVAVQKCAQLDEAFDFLCKESKPGAKATSSSKVKRAASSSRLGEKLARPPPKMASDPSPLQAAMASTSTIGQEERSPLQPITSYPNLGQKDTPQKRQSCERSPLFSNFGPVVTPLRRRSMAARGEARFASVLSPNECQDHAAQTPTFPAHVPPLPLSSPSDHKNEPYCPWLPPTDASFPCDRESYLHVPVLPLAVTPSPGDHRSYSSVLPLTVTSSPGDHPHPMPVPPLTDASSSSSHHSHTSQKEVVPVDVPPIVCEGGVELIDLTERTTLGASPAHAPRSPTAPPVHDAPPPPCNVDLVADCVDVAYCSGGARERTRRRSVPYAPPPRIRLRGKQPLPGAPTSSTSSNDESRAANIRRGESGVVAAVLPCPYKPEVNVCTEGAPSDDELGDITDDIWSAFREFGRTGI